MNDPSMSNLLKWSLQNSSGAQGSTDQTDSSSSAPAARGLDPQALAQLLGGPSDADLMREAMAVIRNEEADLESKLVAFDNFEQLVENMDNANNMPQLGLWEPLVQQLESAEADLRRYAAWCLGTAVQNNVKSQAKLLDSGAIPTLVRLALHDADAGVRKKAIGALSSGVRNYQPALDRTLACLPAEHGGGADAAPLDANDMDSVDGLINRLRADSAKKASA